MPDAERLEEATWFCHKCGRALPVLIMGCGCERSYGCWCWYDQDGQLHPCGRCSALTGR